MGRFKWSVGLVVAWVASMALVGCGDQSGQSEAQAQERVVVYSARAEHLVKPLFDAFTEQTGIEVQFQTGRANALVERLRAEGASTPADILMTVDAGNLWYAADQDLFQPMSLEVVAEHIPAHLRDPDGLWTGLSVRARTLVYSTERVSPEDLSGYEALGDEAWRGRLCLRTSDSVYNKSLVAALIAHQGEEASEQIVRAWVDNLAARPHSRDVHVMEAILAGQCDVGVVNTYYFGRLQAEKPEVPLALFWADQAQKGTHINVSGAGILKHAQRVDNAQRLIDWLASDEAQRIYGALNREYPANPNIEVDELVATWGDFKQDELNLRQVGELQQAATMLINRAGYE